MLIMQHSKEQIPAFSKWQAHAGDADALRFIVKIGDSRALTHRGPHAAGELLQDIGDWRPVWNVGHSHWRRRIHHRGDLRHTPRPTEMSVVQRQPAPMPTLMQFAPASHRLSASVLAKMWTAT